MLTATGIVSYRSMPQRILQQGMEIVMFLVLFCTLLSHVLRAQQPPTTAAEIPIPTAAPATIKVPTVHYTETDTQYDATGKPGRSIRFDSWYKDPDRFRIEFPAYYEIIAGEQSYYFSKDEYAYKESVKPDFHFNFTYLTAKSDIAYMRDAQKRIVSVKTDKAQYLGKPVVEVTIHGDPMRNADGSLAARYDERQYADPVSGLLLWKEIDDWSDSGSFIKERRTTTFEYGDIADTLFQFTPPPHALNSISFENELKEKLPISAHWDETTTIIGQKDPPSVVETLGWYKTPDKSKFEFGSFVEIGIGTQVTKYDKREKKYSKGSLGRNMNELPQLFFPTFVVAQQFQQGNDVIVNDTSAEYNGTRYSVIELQVKPTHPQGNEHIGPRVVRLFIDPITELIKVKECKQYDITGQQLLRTTIDEYDYSELTDADFSMEKSAQEPIHVQEAWFP